MVGSRRKNELKVEDLYLFKKIADKNLLPGKINGVFIGNAFLTLIVMIVCYLSSENVNIDNSNFA